RPWPEIACALLALALYLRTLAPTVAGGDSGELLTVGAPLGVAPPARHPLRGRYATAFVSGLALANHHTVVFVAAPFLAYQLWRARALLTTRVLATLGAAGGAGLLPYLYLPWAAARHPAVAWGDPSTWSGFWAHLLRREYGTFRLASAEV